MWNDMERRNAFGRYAAKHIDSSVQDTGRYSVSRERQSPLPEDMEDNDSTRFIQELEARDELDHIIEKAHFSSAEQLVLTGLRCGLKGNKLEDYVLQHPEGNSLKRESIPVLANRVRSKLKTAAQK
jgi:hypothetical protein